MFGALKHGFRSLATLKIVVNVVDELYKEAVLSQGYHAMQQLLFLI